MFKIITFLYLVLYSAAALSWGAIGHQTVGEIAERFISPEAKIAINDILGPEKLAIAAIWADEVRDDPDFNLFKPYHFISIESSDPYDSIPQLLHDQKDSVTVLKNFPSLIKDKDTPRSVKMIALKYLIHVIGDIHQPLHVGKKSDAGGNLILVKWNADQTTNLHAVWDEKIIEFDISQLKKKYSPLKFYSFLNYADDILKSHIVDEKIKNLNYIDWIKESQDLRSSIYSNDLPIITDEYKQQATTIVENRLFYGGVRLALFLNDLFKEGSNPGINISLKKEEVLAKLNFNNY